MLELSQEKTNRRGSVDLNSVQPDLAKAGGSWTDEVCLFRPGRSHPV